MNQDDFRQMVSSREGNNAAQTKYGGKRNLSEADLAEVKKLSAKMRKKKLKKSKIAISSNVADAIDHRQPLSQYRDRAAERRRGKAGEEQSKVSTGNMEHSSLVKGLDYALLGQLKREKQSLLAEKRKLINESDTEKSNPPKNQNDTITFKTGLGRLVFFHACQSTLDNTKSVKSELFLPGRMYYTYNLSPTEIESVPVSVQRSREDCPDSDEVVTGLVDDSIIARVAEITVNRLSTKKKERKRRECHVSPEETQNDGIGSESAKTDITMVEAEVVVDVDDDDEDIFPDMDPYVPIDQRPVKTSLGQEREDELKKAGYFSNLSAAITEKECAARKKEEQLWKGTLHKAVEAQHQIEREKERRAKEAKMIGEADDYAEYQDIGGLGDSDDDDDEEAARRRKAAGLSKINCDPEEKFRRKKQKQKSKLANDLEKINKIMSEKANKS
ncbi:putative RED-like protein [Plasmopara halstedii]